jgi:hypothetical protein
MLPRRYALGLSLATALVAGCGGQAIVGNPPQVDSVKTITPDGHGTRRDLLYLPIGADPPHVIIATYPQGKMVGTLAHISTVWGMCADNKGNVWVDNGYQIFKFAHGGTKSIAKLTSPVSGLGTSCAVDPTTGDLAVIELASGGTVLNVWPNAQGEPTTYTAPFEAVGCTYDNSGNLFIDGAITSTQDLALAELPNGGSQFNNITLSETSHWAGGMVWDGQYLAVNTLLPTKPRSQRHLIFRISVSGSEGQVVDTIPLKHLFQTVFFAIQGRTLVTTSNRGTIALWNFPKGGAPFKQLRGLPGNAFGIALSQPP